MRSLLPFVRSLSVSHGDSLGAESTALLVKTGGRRLGRLSREVVTAIVESDDARRTAGLEPRFAFDEAGRTVTLAPWLALADASPRTLEFAALIDAWRQAGTFEVWPTSEVQHVYSPDGDADLPVYFDIERSATALFGFPAIAVSVNGPSADQ